MKIGIIKEMKPHEKRVSLTPQGVKMLKAKSYTIIVEKDAGEVAGFTNEEYQKEEAEIASDRSDLIAKSDVIVSYHAPDQEAISMLSIKKSWISPLYHKAQPELIKTLSESGGSFISLDAIPRISRAQSMDILSSQSNLSGYKAVLIGANALQKIFPMLMTAAGTVKPAKVLIFGVGVAGLQAIATAKRLGAVVEATDVRPETKEEAESLGAKFITVESEGVQTQGGYATDVSADYIARQKEAVNKSLFSADLIITTALVQGKKAPLLITDEQLQKMKNGAVVVDMAVEQGGNCAGSKPNETIQKHGVHIIGPVNLPSSLAYNASELYSRNVVNFLTHISSSEGFHFNMDDEIIRDTLIVRDGEILLKS
jgi:H+-translocating NAD(P) transhydrogenase subunit alpha